MIKKCAILFLLDALCSCQPSKGLDEACLDVQARINQCLTDYCMSTTDAICAYAATSRGSLLGGDPMISCEGLSQEELDSVLASDCAAVIDGTRESLSGKADAPCPAYFPWCNTMTYGSDGYTLEVLSYDAGGAVLDITLSDVLIESIIQGGEEFQRLEIPGNGTTTLVGYPAVPVINLILGAPRDVTGARVASYEETEARTFEGINALPYQPLVREADAPALFAKDPSAYAAAGPYPETAHEMDPAGIWRNYKALRIKLHPLRYYPASGRLEVAARFVVGLAFDATGTDDPDTIDEGEAGFQTAYGSVMANYQELSDGFAPPAADDPGRIRYLIITVDELAPALDPLVKLKDEQGLKTRTVLLSEIFTQRAPEKNADAAKIKDFITALYKQQGIEYVLLAGEVEKLPMYEWTDNDGEALYGDYGYSLLAGDDLLPEIAVGRLAGATPEEISAQISKTVGHSTGDLGAFWRQKVLLVAHRQDAPKKYTECLESIRTGSYSYPAGFMKLYGHERATNQNIIDAMNQGVGIINYRGHGDVTNWSGWNDEDFVFSSYQAANGDMLPVVFSIACLNARLEAAEETLAEQFVKRAGGGAVAFLGATKPSWTKPNHDFDRFLFKAILDKGVKQIGQISNVAAVELLNMWGDDYLATENIRMYVWLGDPSLRVEVGNPPETAVNVGWCNLQHPFEAAETADLPATDIFGQVWADGFTNLPGPAPFLLVQLGYGPTGTLPAPPPEGSDTAPQWTWKSAWYNLDSGNNDEYMARLSIHTPGQYLYTYRVSGDGGVTFLYCDKDGSDNGVAVDQLGLVTVQPRPAMTATSAQLSWPYTVTVKAGDKTEKLQSQLRIDSATFREDLIPFIQAQLGYGPAGTLPDAPDSGWTWKSATFDSNWSGSLTYSGTFTFTQQGSYLFAFRFSMDDAATWIYADKDGSSNGLAADQLGTITVNP